MTLKRYALIPQRVEVQTGVRGGCTICSCYWSKLRGHRWQVTATYLHDIDEWASSRPPTSLRNGPCCSSFRADCGRHYSSMQETQAKSTTTSSTAWYHLTYADQNTHSKPNFHVYKHENSSGFKCNYIENGLVLLKCLSKMKTKMWTTSIFILAYGSKLPQSSPTQ